MNDIPAEEPVPYYMEWVNERILLELFERALEEFQDSGRQRS